MNNGTLVDTMVNDALWDAFNNYHMIKTADNICEQWGLTREEIDQFAVNSQAKATKAQEEGRFKDEIVPVEVKVKKNTVIVQNFVQSIRTDLLQQVMHQESMTVQQQSLLCQKKKLKNSVLNQWQHG